MQHRDEWGATPLYYASLCGHLDLVNYLLDKGAKAEEKTFDGERAYYAALNDDIRKVLRDKGFKRKVARGHDPFLQAIEKLLVGDATVTQQQQQQLFADLELQDQNLAAAEGAAAGLDDEDSLTRLCVHLFVIRARCPVLEKFLTTRAAAASNDKKRNQAADLEGGGGGRSIVDIPTKFFPIVKSIVEYLYTNRFTYDGNLRLGEAFLSKCKLKDLARECAKKISCREGEGEGGEEEEEGRGDKEKASGGSLVIEPETVVSRARMQDALQPYAMFSWCNPETAGIRVNEDYYDVLLVADGGQAYRTHKALLVVRSEYFHLMFLSGFRESDAAEGGLLRVELSGITSRTLEVFIHWIYTDELPKLTGEEKGCDGEEGGAGNLFNDIHQVLDVLMCADQFLCDGLKTLCALAVSKFITPASCVQLLSVSISAHCDRMYDECLLEVAKHMLDMTEDDKKLFLQLVKESASEVKEREDVDTIGLIDDLRYLISHLHRDDASSTLRAYDEEGEEDHDYVVGTAQLEQAALAERKFEVIETLLVDLNLQA